MPKRKTRADYRFEWFERLRGHVDDMMRSAIHFKKTHTEILADRTAQIHEHDRWKHLTHCDRQRVSDRFSAWIDLVIYPGHIEWWLGPKSGPTHKQHDEWTDEMSDLARSGQLWGAHFWSEPVDALGFPLKLWGKWENLNGKTARGTSSKQQGVEA